MADPTPVSAPIPRLLPLADVAAALLADHREAWDARCTGRPRGPVTGLAPLDHALGGQLEPGAVVLCRGQAGVGRTALGLQAAAACAAAGVPALVVTAEQAPTELLRRLVCHVTGEFLGKLRGELAPARMAELISRTVEACPRLVLADAVTEPVRPAQLDEWLPAATWGAPFGLCVLDSVQSWASGWAPTTATEYDALGAAMYAIRELVTRHQSPSSSLPNATGSG
ncbi:MAG TPA: AAA family ATPase [Candidatus Dormibacteraeota bacterium]|nr:AAA family ATPase [Candidatus Dormibacteraeota bacterium]